MLVLPEVTASVGRVGGPELLALLSIPNHSDVLKPTALSEQGQSSGVLLVGMFLFQPCFGPRTDFSQHRGQNPGLGLSASLLWRAEQRTIFRNNI